MRPEHYLNYGYTPTCQAALERLAGLLNPTEDRQGILRLFDPCAGDGAALAALAEALTAKDSNVETYGVEIEAGRAQAAEGRLHRVIYGDVRRTMVSHRSMSLALCNPPYDNTGGEQSPEKTIIRRTLPYLVPGGVIVLVIPERLLAWAEHKLSFKWLAFFPTEDPKSPNQYVLVGQPAEEKYPLPAAGTMNTVTLPHSRIDARNMIFRVSWLTEDERADALASSPLQALYQDEVTKRQKVIHPLRPGHRAAYLAGYAATLKISQGYLRVAVREEESRKAVGDNQTRIVRGPKMTSYLLSKADGLVELPFEDLPEYAEEIDKAISLETYVDEDAQSWPAAHAWEEAVLDRINARLPEMNGRRGLLPPQAVRAVGMARALLAGEKTVFGIMQMGYGKSPISLTVRELVKAKKHIGLTVILCPPHLLKKWKREAEMLAPGATVIYPEGNGEDRLAQVQRVLKAVGADQTGSNVILILSRSMVKLGPYHKPQLERKYFPSHGRLWACPHCGTPATTEAEENWGRVEILRYSDVYQAPAKSTHPDADPPRRLRSKSCSVCGRGYAGPEPSPRRWPLADVIYRAVKRGTVKDLYLIADECHEYRNASLQGMAFSRLFRVAKYAVLLTGTIFGGKASDLYRLLRWTSPEIRQAGYSERQFVSRFGYMEAIETREEARAFGRTKVKRTSFKERPGVSPTIYRFLLPRTAFGALEDVAEALPGYEEQRITVPAPDVPVGNAFSKNHGGQLYHEKGMGAFMTWMIAALGYYNIAAVEPSGQNGNRSHKYSFTSYDEDGEAVEDTLVLDLPYVDTSAPLPKEAKLIEIAQAEKARHRKIALLIEQTTTRPLPQRLVPLLKEHGIRAVYLDTKRVQASRREEWIEKHAYGMDVLITHPKAVETGLDLVMLQTVVVYEAIYKVISLAQAIARVFRLGQNQPVKVISLAYEDNLEGVAWPVIARKISWAKSVYGNFIQSSLGGADMDENLDLLSALKSAITTSGSTAEDQLMPERILAGIERERVASFELEQVLPNKLERDGVITLQEWMVLRGVRGEGKRRARKRQPIPETQMELL